MLPGAGSCRGLGSPALCCRSSAPHLAGALQTTCSAWSGHSSQAGKTSIGSLLCSGCAVCFSAPPCRQNTQDVFGIFSGGKRKSSQALAAFPARPVLFASVHRAASKAVVPFHIGCNLEAEQAAMMARRLVVHAVSTCPCRQGTLSRFDDPQTGPETLSLAAVC